MNFVALTGRTTKDFSVYTTKGGLSVGKCIIAVDTGFGEKKKTSYIGFTVFGSTADYCSQFVNTGDLIEITGNIETGQYNKKTDNTTVYTTDVIVERLKKLSSSGKTATQNRDDFVKYNNTASKEDNVQVTALDDDMPF